MIETKDSKRNQTHLPCVVIITALKEECQAVTAHLSDLGEDKDRYNNIYDCGYFEGSTQTWKVAVAEIGVGNIPAAIKVVNAVNHFDPDVLLLVGVAGGLKDEISLGSVVASTKIYGYQAGKADESFQVRPEIACSDSGLDQRARATARKNIWIQRIINPQFSADTPPEAHVKPIAAGDQVISSTNSPTFKLLRDHYSDAVAVEMEGYGVLCAARETGVPSIVIRGISDQIDNKHKADKKGWQRIAASHASAFAFEMLANYAIMMPKSSLDRGGIEVRKTTLASLGRQVEKLISPSEQSETNLSDLVSKFYAASKTLLNWPCTLDGSKWLDRKEFEQITGIINTHSQSLTILLGEPGSGKTSLLSKLAHNYFAASIPILAIKADELEVDINSQLKLAEYLDLPTKPDSCVKMVAQTRAIIVFIDQLDALADLVDLKSERLNVVLDFLHELSDIENVHVICSCRIFEFQHDVRLNSISAENITLELPEWKDVAAVLGQKGVNAGQWPQHFREILRTPQHLKIFLNLLRGPDEYELFETYHSMLDRFWEREISGENIQKAYSELVNRLAYQMAEEETLWLPLIRYEEYADVIQKLERVGILVHSLDGRRIAFRHQTILDYAAARAFIHEHISLAQYVFERQNALFVRPRLWNTLIYLRNADLRAYKREFTKLWEAQDLRLHIRYLLIEFLGKLDTPDEQEAKWLLDCIDNTSPFRDKALLALSGNRSWFDIIADRYLPALMGDAPEKSSSICVVLQGALPFARDKVVELLVKFWLSDPARYPLILQILSELARWEDNAVNLVCNIVSRTQINVHLLMHIASLISASAPDLAPKIVARSLDKTFQVVSNTGTEDQSVIGRSDLGGNNTIRDTSLDKHDLVKRILEQDDYYGLPDIAEAAPIPFLDDIWPWFIKVLDNITKEGHPLMVSYRSDYSLATRLAPEDRNGREYPIVQAIERAIVEIAVKQPDTFLQFLKKWESSEYMVVQRLLARGLLRIASTHPEECLNFLMGDVRRMVLEDELSEDSSETRALINACISYLTEDQVRALEAHILKWSEYGDFPEDDVKTRFERKKWDRRARLNLLRAIHSDKLSPTTRVLVLKEERAFPHGNAKRVGFTGVHSVGSPMSSAQMAKAKDTDILNLFAELPDATGWDHPKRDRFVGFVGGSIQASRSFAEFAKQDVKRSTEIMRQFPLTNQRPAGFALRAIAETDYPSDELFEIIKLLDQKGFNSVEFLTSAAEALSKRAKPPVGLPSSMCILLEKWLSALSGNGKQQDEVEKAKENQKTPHSILWKYAGFEVIPQGTYTIIEALTQAYLMRDPMDHAQWLTVLEDHLKRGDSTRTWRAVALWQLKYLQNCDKGRGVRFLNELFAKYPPVLHSHAGAYLIANLQWWLPKEAMLEFLISTRDSKWSHGVQAYAELFFLYSISIEDEDTDKEMETLLKKFANDPIEHSKIGLGFAYAAANLWRDPRVRGRVTDVMVRMIPYVDKAQSKAIMDVFRLSDPLMNDKDTLRFLDAIHQNPHVIKFGGDSFLIDRIQDLIPAKPEIAFSICKTIVETLKNQITDIGTSWYASAQELVNIALTLQRYEGKNREQGLELFEMLLELNAYGAKSTLDELDGRPINVNPRPPRRRRRSGK